MGAGRQLFLAFLSGQQGLRFSQGLEGSAGLQEQRRVHRENASLRSLLSWTSEGHPREQQPPLTHTRCLYRLSALSFFSIFFLMICFS